MALLVAIFLSFTTAFFMILFVNWLDRYEKEPILLMLAAFLWGVVIAAGGAYDFRLRQIRPAVAVHIALGEAVFKRSGVQLCSQGLHGILPDI